MGTIRSIWLAGLAALTSAVVMTSSASGQQVACPGDLPAPGAGRTWICSVSSTHHTTLTSETLPNAFIEVVQIVGGASSGGTVLIPALTFAAGVAAVTTDGGPGVVDSSPVLLSQTDVTGLAVVVSSTTSIQNSVTTDRSDGPGLILVGEDQSLTYFVPSGFSNLNTNTHTETFIRDQLQATVTRTSIYSASGVVQPVGLVHAAVQSAGFDAASAFLPRLAQQAGGIAPPAPSNEPVLTALDPAPVDYWLDFYGSVGMTPASGGTPGDNRAAGGFDAGFRADLSNLSLAAAVNHSVTALSVPATSETGTIQLTQLGVALAKHIDDWVMRGAVVAGLGRADTTTTLGGTSTATYGVRTAGALLEVGRSLDIEVAKLTPLLGVDLTLSHSDAFTGSGGAALSAPAHDAARLRAWLGLEATASWLLKQGTLSFAGHGRIVAVPYGMGRTLPVTFAGLLGTPLTITGAPEAPIALDLGTEAKLDAGMFEVFANYDAHIQPSAISHTARVGLRGTF